MLNKLARTLRRSSRGITGIETAIILIAFVVVASVFAYVVLSAGLFSSQKSQEAIYNSLQTTQSTIELKGAVVGIAAHTGLTGYFSQITFTVSAAMSGTDIDFTGPDPNLVSNNGRANANSPNKVVVTFMDSYQKIDDLYWKLTKLGASGTDNMLHKDEQFQITIGETTAGADGGLLGGNLVDALSGHHLGANTKFTIEVKPPTGAVLSFERTTPPFIDTVMNLN
jgi:archaeal flagellin FlaB